MQLEADSSYNVRSNARELAVPLAVALVFPRLVGWTAIALSLAVFLPSCALVDLRAIPSSCRLLQALRCSVLPEPRLRIA